MTTPFPLSRRQFGEFILRTRGRGCVRGDNLRCPMTRAIQYTVNSPNITIAAFCNNDNGNISIIIPTWVYQFIELYDKGMSAVDAARKIGSIL